MPRASVRRPHFTYRTATKTCHRCGASFGARYEIIRSQCFPAGRQSWLDHRCPRCNGSRDVIEHQGGGFDWPAGPEWGTTELVKRAKGVENHDGFRLGWIHQYEKSEE